MGDMRSTVRHLKPTTVRFGICKRLLAFKSVRLSDRDFYYLIFLRIKSSLQPLTIIPGTCKSLNSKLVCFLNCLV